MNRPCHRLVFNRARGQLMAVAETTSSRTSAPGQVGGSGACLQARVRPLGLAAWLACGLVTWMGLAAPAGAQISADRAAPGNQRPTVLRAPSGVPLVHVQTPSAAGVSRNAYRQFDVDRQGAILNNSRTDVRSQLGGWVQANPWLAKASARIILNEVNSADPSQLKGYIEVAGQRAQVVIANPAGITCDGCGFIHAERATLATGVPQMAGGDLTGMRVDKGQVRIIGQGLDGRAADFTDIIARAVAVDANILASTLTVRAGAQGAAPGVSAVAIDVSSLGGLYAGSIRLVGNGSGVGVRNAGHIGASAGDVVVTAQGRLENTGAGRIYGDRVVIRADQVVNDGEGGQAPVIAARERLDMGVATLDNREHALIFSAGDIAIGGALDPDRQAQGEAGIVRNTSATIEALGRLRIAAREVVNTDAHFSTEVVTLPTQRVTELAGAGAPNRHAPGTPDVYIYNDESDHLHTPEGNHETWHRYEYTRNVSETRIARADPARILSGGDMQLLGGSIINDRGHIIAGGDLAVRVGTLTNTEPPGSRTTHDEGVVTTYWRDHHKGRDSTGIGSAPYVPPAYVETITLGASVSKDHTAPSGSGTTLKPLVIDRPDVPPAPAGARVRGGSVDLRIPESSLFHVAPDPHSRYLVETDPRFAGFRRWLGTDYLLDALAQDPASLGKRLGDGLYEQRLVREQVTQLTGRRLLAGYSSDEAQFRALMDNGATFARAVQLRPGVALSAQQVAQLTSDIVWLVEQEVTLPDGRSVRALVPQVYTRVRDDDLQPSGALIAGRTLDVQLTGDLFNSGALQGVDAVLVDADSLRNVGGRMAADRVRLRSLSDLENTGGQIRAGTQLVLDAGRDLHVASTMARTTSAQGYRDAIDRRATLYVASPDGRLSASAGRDVNFTAANVRSEGGVAVQAGRDLRLGALEVSSSEAVVRDAANYRREARRSQVGTAIDAQAGAVLIAGNDLTARAAVVRSAQGGVVAAARQDVRIEAGEGQVMLEEAHRETDRGFLSSKTTDTHKSLDDTTAQASAFSGRTTAVEAGRDLTVAGSQVTSDEGTRLAAGGNVTVEAAAESRTTLDERRVKRSGLFSSGGFGVTIGNQRQAMERTLVATTAAASTVGSVNGDAAIASGRVYRQVGSEVLAPRGDIAIDAERIEIVEARQSLRQDSQARMSQSGVTVSLSNPMLSAASTFSRVHEAARETGDARMQALAALAQGLAVHEAGGQVEEDPRRAGGVSLSVSLGSRRSASRTVQASDSAASARSVAGGDLTVRARGAGAQSDIVMQGGQVEAGGGVDLQADDEVRLLAARNQSTQHSDNRSSSASVGVSFGFGSKGAGWSVTAHASQGRGRADGDDETWTHTRVQAGSAVHIDSGGAMTLRGAVVSAPQVAGRIGGDLLVESLQDTASYTSQQRSLSAGASVGSTRLSGQVSTSRSDADKRFASVPEQSGVMAGDGGFDIEVQGGTDLRAGLLGSSDEAAAQGRNRLVTSTLTSSDLENRASARASSSGFSVSSDMLTKGKYDLTKGAVANTLLNAEESIDAQGRTRATVSGGAIVISDETAQRARTGQAGAQIVASLNRDAKAAHVGVLRPDLESVQRSVNAHRVIKEETFRAVTAFTDEAYRSRFEVKPRLFKVVCPPGADCVNHRELLERTAVTAQDIANAPPGSVLAVNGILNDEKRAAQLAYQNTGSRQPTSADELEKPRVAYLMHIAPSRNTLSELLGVAYERIVADADYGLANFLGYTNGQALYADLLRSRGQQETVSLGHSRGTLVQEAAFTILAHTRGSEGEPYINPNLNVRGVGGAANVETYSKKGLALLGAPDKAAQVSFTYFANDPVATSSLAGGNPGVWGLADLWAVMTTSTSMHSCYGSGAAGCTQVEAPLPGGPQGTPDGNARLVRYAGGRRVTAEGAQAGGAR